MDEKGELGHWLWQGPTWAEVDKVVGENVEIEIGEGFSTG